MTTAQLAVVAALCAMSVLGGMLLIAAGLRATPTPTPRPRTSLWVRLRARRRDGRTLLLLGLGGGVLGFAVTGWPIALVLVPGAVLGLPVLLAPAGRASVDRLDAMAEWTRALAGVLTVGVGLEQALITASRSTPAAIRPEVEHLTARLRARWSTEDALRAFADELDDATGDLIAAALILGSRRRGAGLAAVLTGLAESVSAEVRVRRQIETERDRPRTTARWVTLISAGMLGLLLVNGTYLAPYSSPLGQLLLALLLAGYVGALLWMRQVVAGKPLPRFLGDARQFGKTETRAPAGVR
ncbi:MAG: type II secretion system F family protein [Candidatus Nanopelagicales bacterium]